VFTIPVPVFVAFTETPGISAPDASDTVPPNTALVVWANVLVERQTNQHRCRKDYFLHLHPFLTRSPKNLTRSPKKSTRRER
jgi:hypothetical protein